MASKMGKSSRTLYEEGIRKLIIRDMKGEGLTHADMAEAIGKSRSMFTTQLKRGNFSGYELQIIFKKIKAEDDEILKVFRP